MKPSRVLRCCALGMAAFVALPASAFLPEADAALGAIDALPMVQAAHAREREAGARGEALRSSPYGYELTIMPLARHERQVGTYGEVESTLMRRLRLPGKARIDDALANAGDDLARYALGDARHEGARRLLDAWVAWVRAANLAALAEQQHAVLIDEQRAVARRVELGELPVLDERRAAAARAQAELAVERARLEREQARLALATEFPTLPLPPAPPVVSPPIPHAPAADMVERIVQHNHELLIARTRAARQGLTAARADADRRPDPSVGLRVLGEGDGLEQAVGVVVSIPFAASGQRATVRAERALGEAIETEATGIEQRVRLEAEQMVRALPAQCAAWSSAAQMVSAAADTLARLDKAWRLGAVDLSELLLARRQAYDARLIELGLRLDAQALAARIDIDSHQRWAADEAH
jgi:outer membrane protein, heavy metal efflux system